MNVSVHLSPQSRGPFEDGALVEDIVERTILAREAGIAGISLTEHHLGGFNTYSDPFMLGGYLAPQLGEMYVGVMVVQVALEHPLRIAERANLLDVVTRGRCLIGLGSGSPRPLEFDAFGIALDDRSAMTEARIQALVQAWAWDEQSSPVDLGTPYDAGVIHARVTPAPHRRPHPLTARATRSDATVLDCARRGWPVLLALAAGQVTEDGVRQADLYRDALLGAGHTQHVADECLAWLGPMTLVCVAGSERDAQRRFEEYVEYTAHPPAGQILEATTGTPAWVAEWQKRQDQKAATTYCGTPEMVIEHINVMCDQVGSRHIRVFMLDIPGRDEENLESYRRFLGDVVPALDPEPLPGPVDTMASCAGRTVDH